MKKRKCNTGSFSIEIALEDNGVCERQRIDCSICPIGKFLEVRVDEMCHHTKVYDLAMLIQHFGGS